MSVYYNDIEPYACKVLRKNIARGHLPEGYVDERDIRTVGAAELRGYQHYHLFAGIGGFPLGFAWAGVPLSLRIVTGGFPCQDISSAGRQAGIDGERSGLWGELCRITGLVRPDYLVVENVANLLSGERGAWMGRVLGDLAALGYDGEWHCIPAAAVGAPHIRDRVWILAYPNGEHAEHCGEPADVAGTPRAHQGEGYQWQRDGNAARHSGEAVAHTHGERCQEQRCAVAATAQVTGTECGGEAVADAHSAKQSERCIESMGRFGSKEALADYGHRAGAQWKVEPAIRRVVDGLPHRVDRLRGLGNAIVPQLAEYIGECIIAHAGGAR